MNSSDGRTSLEWLAITLPLFGASLAWLYEKAWERQERRVSRYEAMTALLPGFTTSGISSQAINQFLAEQRRLWLFAPDDVIRALDRFVDRVEGTSHDGSPEEALGRLVLAMRRDASFRGAIFPRFFSTSVDGSHFRIRTATGAAHPELSIGDQTSVEVQREVPGAKVRSSGDAVGQ